MNDDACYHCGSPATLLCDFVIGREKVGEQFKKGTLASPHQGWYPVTSIESDTFTCDRPLCEGCATNAGHWFACGRGGFTDSIDRCKDHADLDQGGLDAPIVTAAEAAAIRAKMNGDRFTIVHAETEEATF